ncbi:MAG TPA: CvpA family protein [Bacteroidota bacterium]
MFVDFAIALPIIAGGLLGFRDGSVRKFVSILVTFGAMFVAKFLMYDLGDVMVEQLNTDPSWAPLQAYLIVFFCILFLQSVLYRVLTDRYKIGGLADRIGGVALGGVHTALVVSVLVTILAMKDIPGERGVKESRAYEPVRNVSSALLNLVTQTVPQASEAIEKLKEQGVGTIVDDTASVKDKLRGLIEDEAKALTPDVKKQTPATPDTLSKK